MVRPVIIFFSALHLVIQGQDFVSRLQVQNNLYSLIIKLKRELACIFKTVKKSLIILARQNKLNWFSGSDVQEGGEHHLHTSAAAMEQHAWGHRPWVYPM